MMKKLFAMILAMLLLLSFTACGGGKSEQNPTDGTKNPVQTTDSDQNQAFIPTEDFSYTEEVLSENKEGWAVYDISIPEVPELTWNQYDGYRLAETAIDLDVDTLYNQLANSEFSQLPSPEGEGLQPRGATMIPAGACSLDRHSPALHRHSWGNFRF